MSPWSSRKLPSGDRRGITSPRRTCHLSIIGARSVHVHTTPLRCQRPIGVFVYLVSRDAQWSRPYPGPIPILYLILEVSIAELLLSSSTLCGACMIVFHRHAPTHMPGLRRQFTRGVSHVFASHSTPIYTSNFGNELDSTCPSKTPAFPLRAFHFTYSASKASCSMSFHPVLSSTLDPKASPVLGVCCLYNQWCT
ncbi:hypothetical protein BJY52DRAFT_754081 [Lactarius psammicola]|nr:hypothetical protein BJY52DRAFT_754081 [Lactarius psammicola]